VKQDFPTDEGLRAAAWSLLCEEAAVRAVAKVESGSLGSFLDDGTPVILFERHLFSRFTSRRFDGERLNGQDWGLLSDQHPGGYGPSSVQHAKLAAAALLDRDAALRAASWGLFQILGDNHDACGYPELQRFVNAMYRSTDDHLRAFVAFVRHDHRKVDAIRSKDWESFARLYNGPGFAKNSYDVKLRKAYEEARAR